MGWVGGCISHSRSECFDLSLGAVCGVGDGDLFTDKFSACNVDPVKVSPEGEKLYF